MSPGDDERTSPEATPPADDDAPEHPEQPRRIGRTALALVIALTLLPPALIGIGWLVEDTRAVLPGMRGCERVRDQAAQRRCLERHFSAQVAEHGLNDAMKQADRFLQERGALLPKPSCHLAWHTVGARAGRRSGDLASISTPPQGRNFCDEGYAHGYVLGVLERNPDAVTADRALELCAIDDSSTPTKRQSRTRRNCYHTMGHAFARRMQPQAASDACRDMSPAEALGGESGPYFQCVYGMWMEFALRDSQKRGDIPLDNCDGVELTARIVCSVFLPGRVEVLAGSHDRGSKACTTMPRTALERSLCADFVGNRARQASACKPLRSRKQLEMVCIAAARGATPLQVETVLYDLLYGTESERQRMLDELSK